MRQVVLFLLLPILLLSIFSSCNESEALPTFKISGIPDQNISELARRYSEFTDYLSKELDVKVEYLPTTDYSATVTSFSQSNTHMGWFGGLTGVQARIAVPGSTAIAQRARDEEFHSVFIFNSDYEGCKDCAGGTPGLEDLKGFPFAFGSESSTSGHLMPRHFLMENGIDPETFFEGLPIFSGSHDKTWAMVQSGAVYAGALSEAVWEKAVENGKVDTSKVQVFYTTPPYYDYNWTIRADADEIFGKGFTDKVSAVIIGIDDKALLDLFSAKKFISSNNSNYEQIEGVARGIGIIE